MFTDLLSQLYSLQLYYKEAHWTAKTSLFYEDHLLLDRLSESAEKHIDSVAEKAIGVTQNSQVVHLPSLLKQIFNKINLLQHTPKENLTFFTESLKLEESLSKLIETMEPTSTIGTKNLLGDIADDMEGRIYLIKQRIKKDSIIPSPISVNDKPMSPQTAV